MPKVGEPINKAPKVVKYDHTQRYICPVCGSLHWWDSTTGCHNKNCTYRGRLELKR